MCSSVSKLYDNLLGFAILRWQSHFKLSCGKHSHWGSLKIYLNVTVAEVKLGYCQKFFHFRVASRAMYTVTAVPPRVSTSGSFFRHFPRNWWHPRIIFRERERTEAVSLLLWSFDFLLGRNRKLLAIVKKLDALSCVAACRPQPHELLFCNGLLHNRKTPIVFIRWLLAQFVQNKEYPIFFLFFKQPRKYRYLVYGVFVIILLRLKYIGYNIFPREKKKTIHFSPFIIFLSSKASRPQFKTMIV